MTRLHDYTNWSATVSGLLKWGPASRKHAYKILSSLNPTFISKTGVYRGRHYFSYFCSKHRLWVLVRTASTRRRLDEAVLTGTHNLCFEQKHEKYQGFLSENFHFLVVKFSVYLNRHVFVMEVRRGSNYSTQSTQ